MSPHDTEALSRQAQKSSGWSEPSSSIDPPIFSQPLHSCFFLLMSMEHIEFNYCYKIYLIYEYDIASLLQSESC